MSAASRLGASHACVNLRLPSRYSNYACKLCIVRSQASGPMFGSAAGAIFFQFRVVPSASHRQYAPVLVKVRHRLTTPNCRPP